LFYIMAQYNLEIRTVHIDGVHNILSDALSRLRIDQFLKYIPNAPHMTLPKLFQYEDQLL
jgi:hypothetical protein